MSLQNVKLWNRLAAIRSQVVLLGIFAVVLITGGCQNSDDEYHEIVNIEQPPVATSPANDKIDSKDAKKRSASSVDSPLSGKPLDESTKPTGDPVASGEMRSNDPPASADPAPDVPNDPPAETKPDNAEPGTDVVADKPDESTKKTGDVGSFINLEDELARQKRMAKLGLGQAETPSEPRTPKLLVTERNFSKEREHDAWRVTYDDLDLLKILNMEPVPLNAVDFLPEWLTQLDGKRIILRGWMFPPNKTEGNKGFIFVRDNQVCCFGPNAKAYDKLMVRLKQGTTVDFINGRPFDVVGTFTIDPWIEDTRNERTGEFTEVIGMLYHIDDAVIIDNK